MCKVKIGLSMLYCLGEPLSKTIKRLGTVDAKYIEIVDDGLHELDKKKIDLLKEQAKSYGLEFSVHAPFADINIASPSKVMLNAALNRFKQSLEFANKLDAKLWVFHPGQRTGISQYYPNKEWKQNIESIKKIYAQSEEYGLNIAFENLPAKYWFIMKNPQDFAKFYRETNLPIGIVLDVGHANLEGQIESYLNQLADKIVHIHVSDNCGQDDDHLGLGFGKIDWAGFAEAVKKIDYDKTIVIESNDHIPQSIQKLKQLFT